MLLDLARSRGILFVGGKGGVGKTSVSAALALARARDGGRVLLVSTDPAHNLGQVWEHELSDAPTRVFEHGDGFVDAVEIDPRQTIERHFAAVAETMLRLLPDRLHDTAYALAVEVAVVDLRLPQEELRLLEMIRDRLKADRLVTAAIEASARARMRTP